MVRSYSIENFRITQCADDGGEILVYVDPTPEERALLVNDHLIDAHTLQSSLDPDELARLEFEPEHAALIIKRPQNYSGGDQFLFRVSSYGIYLFKTRLIVVIMEDIPLFDHKLFTRVYSLHDVVLKIIYHTIHHYLDHLKVINMISDSLEDKINTSMKNKYLINLFMLEKSLVYYVNAINSNAFVIERLKNNATKIGFAPEGVEMLDDIIIENNQCFRQAEIYSNILAGLMDARVSIVSNNLNILMKTLNIITIGIMVPTFVVSAFSMNVEIPFQKHPLAFWMVMGLSLVAVLCFTLVWRFKKW
ncbi:MAG TPA: magnesium transporter CorA family protein [Spirochaetota bacterium]|nr:magnesium transporter CorA family protein [Spirochaetota bacterium]